METIKIQQAFGQVIKSIRMEKGISQEKLAELVDLHRTYISDIERGGRNVSLVNIFRIAEGLDVKVFEIFQKLEKETDE
ncbi:helix-turn-helix domain-containing protein [Planomicrobium sp. MB-3u-38]|uniref:helix-turn-helix domain-containing protein n=1 Tax=Planomicrobium sp. MB-3u-38 TaxID=2058318 RepID=UPI000C7AC0B9|nr:helix-turn-helix transcriptional regulator [Planomicrobium sp. MB-3u-38]PKH10585.1 XRE family transcriptional regulator [Planomicrobium sp. MB-3u-38]